MFPRRGARVRQQTGGANVRARCHASPRARDLLKQNGPWSPGPVLDRFVWFSLIRGSVSYVGFERTLMHEARVAVATRALVELSAYARSAPAIPLPAPDLEH